MEVVPGLYQHFKVNRYRVLGILRHSETLEELVLYRALYHSTEYGAHAEWVRPLAMWQSTVSRDGYSGPRFRLTSKDGPFHCTDCGAAL